MKINIRKGSYHQYCRSKYQSESGRSPNKMKLARLNQKQHQLEEFQNFQTYLMFLKQKEIHDRKRTQSQHQRNYLTAQSSRPRTMTTRRKLHLLDETQTPKQPQKLIKPFFPFYKCRIQSASSPTRQSREGQDSNFRISNKRFKLNHRIIEENKAKIEDKFYW